MQCMDHLIITDQIFGVDKACLCLTHSFRFLCYELAPRAVKQLNPVLKSLGTGVKYMNETTE